MAENHTAEELAPGLCDERAISLRRLRTQSLELHARRCGDVCECHPQIGCAGRPGSARRLRPGDPQDRRSRLADRQAGRHCGRGRPASAGLQLCARKQQAQRLGSDRLWRGRRLLSRLHAQRANADGIRAEFSGLPGLCRQLFPRNAICGRAGSGDRAARAPITTSAAPYGICRPAIAGRRRDGAANGYLPSGLRKDQSFNEGKL